MTLRLEKFDGTKTYMTPSGAVYTPDRIRAEFPAVDHFVHVLEINGDVCQAVLNLRMLRSMYNIDESLSETEAIQAIEGIINTPPPEPEVSTEERIVAATELQNMLKILEMEVK